MSKSDAFSSTVPGEHLYERNARQTEHLTAAWLRAILGTTFARGNNMKLGSCGVAVGLVLLGGCATSTRTPVRQASTAPPTSTQLLTSSVMPADDPRLVAANRYAKEMGYKIEMRHGVQFYCRTTAPLGSRLTEKQCLTIDGLTQAGQIAEQNKATFQQNQLCQGPNCVIK